MYKYEEMVSAIKKLAEEIANLHIDRALLKAELDSAKARIEELENKTQE